MNDLKKVYQVHADVWSLHRKYYSPQTDAEWDALAEEAGKLMEKYEKDPELEDISFQLICAVTRSIDNRWRKEKKENERNQSNGTISHR